MAVITNFLRDYLRNNFVMPYVKRTIRVIGNFLGDEITICSLACFSGGLLFGPIGLAIGGVVGGLAAYLIGIRRQNIYPNTKNTQLHGKL